MRRSAVARIVVFVSIVLGVLVSAHVYLARRLIYDVQLPDPLHSLALAGTITLGTTLLLQPVSERLFPRGLARALGWTASLWMGFGFLGVTMLGVSDLGLAVVRSFVDIGVGSLDVARGRAWGVLGAVAVVGAYGVRQALAVAPIKRVEIELSRWPAKLDGFRIVQLSDIHIGPILRREHARRMVERANACEPDLVAITGDLVDGSVHRLAGDVAPFADLRSKHGAFFVTGNHDHYSDARHWTQFVASLGITVLRNERVTIGDAEASFDLAGVDDRHGDAFGGGEDVDAALQARDDQRPVVLLAHDPNTFLSAIHHDVDLQLSGHTHGGQIWPFAWLVRLATQFVAGLYRVGGSTLYVSRGTGFWGPPMRLGATPEITELILRPPVR